jgi:pyruvate carboxylase
MQAKSFEDVRKELKDQPLLVANRGIPARRIARSMSEVLQAVPIITATEVDKTAPFTSGAGELLLLGEDSRSYLDIDRIIERARARNVLAIHPGWGFASEDDSFPSKCREAGIKFIGPPSEAMRFLGNKVSVRNFAKRLDIPVVPGSETAVEQEDAESICDRIGYPVMLKAEGGGGGRGIYEVYGPRDLHESFGKASSLAQAEFGNPRLFVEKLLTSVRHIEIQVVADRHGNAVALDERDCTVQRNHQKLVEITPSPWSGITPELRRRLKDYALKLIREAGYHSLATVEFLVDAEATPYLVEVNTRLQVEHGITECRYGIDLVEEQIAISFGSRLRWSEADLPPLNHAMQVRINCEDPKNGFAPNGGTITRYMSPGGQGVRVDSCLAAGYSFPTQYDSAGSLLIAYGGSWNKILGVMERALHEYTISGLKTTIPFHRQIVKHPAFRSGDFDTNFVAHTPELLRYEDRESEAHRLAGLIAEISARGYNPFVELGEYRNRGDKRLGRLDPVLPEAGAPDRASNAYPRGDRDGVLDYVRDSGLVHFTDTTPRDITQSNSGNRFRLAEDRLVGPYLDQCNFFSIENGGGAHFHVAMLANMTYPFSEAREWNVFAPRTQKQILIRSTNVLGYKPQPPNVMRLTAEMICQDYDVIRCFDFLNHIENMKPFAEVALNSEEHIFEPALSLSWARGFDVTHYLEAASEIVGLASEVTGLDPRRASRRFILGLKDMAGVCPPRFIGSLVRQLRERYPDLVLHYHRHYTDGLFVPAVGEAARAGAHIVDTAIGASVRWYGQGEVLSTAAYMEGELGLETNLDKDMIRKANFVLKQVMPYYDRYCSPYFKGIDYDVVEHGMPGGATSSSQEGAMKQGYIHLLPSMLTFLAGTRKIVRYHDVTPGSQITWNTAFLAVTGAYKRGGEPGVRELLSVLDAVVNTPEEELPEDMRRKRLEIYRDSNDAFRDLLLGKYGRLPLGFPPDWVYESAFGSGYREALENRTEESPLARLQDMDIERERAGLARELDRDPTEEELVMYLNHPGDALKTMRHVSEFGDQNQLPLDIWFEGAPEGEELYFHDRKGKPHRFLLLDVSEPNADGMSVARYTIDSETLSREVQVAEPEARGREASERADPNNPLHVGAPCAGDLWVMHVKPGDAVRAGQEVCNISVMKQEKSVLAEADGIVRRVLKHANYQVDKRMVPVREGELLVELGPQSSQCPSCSEPFGEEGYAFCPYCGQSVQE